MIYNIINVLSIVIGGFLGMLLKRYIPERITQNVMKAAGLLIIYMAVTMLIAETKMLLVVLTVVIGTVLGAWIDIDGKINRLVNKLDIVEEGTVSVSTPMEAFVFSTILFCSGSMAILGSIQAGLLGNGDILLTKSVLDAISAIIYGASLGIGVVISAVSVLVYQGAFVLLSSVLSPVFDTKAIALISAVGGVLILGIGINMVANTKLKVSNMIPAIVLSILLAVFKMI